MSKRWQIRTVIIILAVLVFIFIVWAGTRPEPTQSPTTTAVVTGTTVMVQVPPLNARAGEAVPLTWRVQAPVGKTATASAIYWGAASKAGALGEESTPQTAAYANNVGAAGQAPFILPREFTGIATFSAKGTFYYRAYALIDSKNYWSPEYSVEVE